MRLHPHEIAIRILEDAFEDGIYPDPRTAFDGKAGALEFLRDLTQEDFGEDAARWREWFRRCSREMLDLHYDGMVRKAKARKARQPDGG
jgi:hypothetical protein